MGHLNNELEKFMKIQEQIILDEFLIKKSQFIAKVSYYLFGNHSFHLLKKFMENGAMNSPTKLCMWSK